MAGYQPFAANLSRPFNFASVAEAPDGVRVFLQDDGGLLRGVVRAFLHWVLLVCAGYVVAGILQIVVDESR